MRRCRSQRGGRHLDPNPGFTLSTTGLEAGHALTILWMVVSPNGSVSVQYAAGHVVGAGGAAQFAGFPLLVIPPGGATTVQACWMRRRPM
jgi:hypothetical protein